MVFEPIQASGYCKDNAFIGSSRSIVEGEDIKKQVLGRLSF